MNHGADYFCWEEVKAPGIHNEIQGWSEAREYCPRAGSVHSYIGRLVPPKITFKISQKSKPPSQHLLATTSQHPTHHLLWLSQPRMLCRPSRCRKRGHQTNKKPAIKLQLVVRRQKREASNQEITHTGNKRDPHRNTQTRTEGFWKKQTKSPDLYKHRILVERTNETL